MGEAWYTNIELELKRKSVGGLLWDLYRADAGEAGRLGQGWEAGGSSG